MPNPLIQSYDNWRAGWGGNAYRPPPAPHPGFWSNVGGGLSSGLGTLAGMFGNMGSQGLGLLGQLRGGGATQATGGVTPSAGGWNIDRNGNLIEPSAAPTRSSASFNPFNLGQESLSGMASNTMATGDEGHTMFGAGSKYHGEVVNGVMLHKTGAPVFSGPKSYRQPTAADFRKGTG